MTKNQNKKVGQAEKLYNMLDKNKTGYLETFELKDLGKVLFKDYLGGFKGWEDVKLLNEVLDMDKDGAVNKADFISYIHQYVMSEDLYFNYSPLKIQHESPT
jgi:Ca2+-binding EF-hand superfamily protein